MAFTCYLLLNTDPDSIKQKNLLLSNAKLHLCVFLFYSTILFYSTAQNFVYGEQDLRPHWVTVLIWGNQSQYVTSHSHCQTPERDYPQTFFCQKFTFLRQKHRVRLSAIVVVTKSVIVSIYNTANQR